MIKKNAIKYGWNWSLWILTWGRSEFQTYAGITIRERFIGIITHRP